MRVASVQLRDGGAMAVEFRVKQNAPLEGIRVRGGTQLPPGLLDGLVAEGRGKPCTLQQLEQARSLPSTVARIA